MSSLQLMLPPLPLVQQKNFHLLTSCNTSLSCQNFSHLAQFRTLRRLRFPIAFRDRFVHGRQHRLLLGLQVAQPVDALTSHRLKPYRCFLPPPVPGRWAKVFVVAMFELNLLVFSELLQKWRLEQVWTQYGSVNLHIDSD